MEIQQTFKCKTCGEPLVELALKSQNGLVECPNCYNVWTIPKKEITPEAAQFLHIAEHDLDTCRFDDAFAAFSKAAELDKEEPEAYFGMALANFKIQYLMDHVNNRLQPICHEITSKKFTDDFNYIKALANATSEQKVEYKKKGEEIDDILAKFKKLREDGVKYDCFICVKVSDGAGGNTEDSKDAEYIYRLLRDKGYRPFYSELELRNVTGADYEARILYALYESECMLVVCRDEQYLSTPWVKNEYTRFLKMVNDEEKESDSITIVFYGTPIEKLAGKKGKIQGIDFSVRSADGTIVDFVDAHTPEAKRRREEEKEQEKRRQEEQEKRLVEMVERLQKANAHPTGSSRGVQATASSLLTRGYQELADGQSKTARDYFTRVLDAEPEFAEAWWGLTMIELNKWSDTQFLNQELSVSEYEKLSGSRNFANARKYASGEFKDHLSEIERALGDKASNRVFEYERKRNLLAEEIDSDEKKNKREIADLQKKKEVLEKQYNSATYGSGGSTKSKMSLPHQGCWLGLFVPFVAPILIIYLLIMFANNRRVDAHNKRVSGNSSAASRLSDEIRQIDNQIDVARRRSDEIGRRHSELRRLDHDISIYKSFVTY